jgi:hypothetical protein
MATVSSAGNALNYLENPVDSTVSQENYNNDWTIITSPISRAMTLRGGKLMYFNNAYHNYYQSGYMQLGMTEYPGWGYCSRQPYPQTEQISDTFFWHNVHDGHNLTPNIMWGDDADCFGYNNMNTCMNAAGDGPCAGGGQGCHCNPAQGDEIYLQLNRDWWDDSSSGSDMTSGIDKSRPSEPCTNNKFYGSTDTGKIYKCVSNSWTTYYQSFTCPHPLTGLKGTCDFTKAGVAGYNVGEGDTTPPAAPHGLSVQ